MSVEGGDISVSQRFFVRVFEFFAYVDGLRCKHPVFAELLSVLIISLLTAFVRLPTLITANWWGQLAITLVFAFFTNRFLLNGLLPTLSYGRLAIAMRLMGVNRVSVDGDNYDWLLRKYLKYHDTDKVIRVICISGRKLFHETGGALHDYALRGKLDVIMPTSDQENPTIKARYGTYSPSLKVSLSLETISDLVDEIARSKQFLAGRTNLVTEHKIFCVWRVVLLSSHCVVQAYFPNIIGDESHKAPVFIYENVPNQRDTCYLIYDAMFELVKRYG